MQVRECAHLGAPRAPFLARGDYEGVDAAGRAAVVRWDSDDEDTADEQIRAAQRAGVKLLLFVNDLDVVRPRINDAVAPPVRTGDEIDVTLPSWGDSGGNHANWTPFGSGGTTQETRLCRDRTLVAEGGSALTATVPSPKETYRLVHEATRTATAAFPCSTATRTEWTFTSARPRTVQDSEQLPLVQLDYTLPTSDDGKAAADAPLLVPPAHLTGGPDSAPRVAKVEVSYDDGATWTTARLQDRGHGTAGVALHAPASAQYLTLRVQAGDGRGNTVTQTVVHAVGITG
ncbi:hypothetical protein ACFC09_14850 [Streptomyces sp. NPDC056161]|uniref:hypothetical protein n=1 Tax=Streptomyces sp. NPDC056161 TaxID=3345732 RepID=UPI0035D53C3E